MQICQIVFCTSALPPKLGPAICGVSSTFLHVPQRTVRRKRFGLEHIECGAAEMAVLQSRHQIVRPRQTAASDIDQHRACFHRVQTLGRQQTRRSRACSEGSQ